MRNLDEREGQSCVGVHVEGPYLNPKRAGEQFAGKLKNPDKEEYTSLLESTDCIKRWDASPELPGALNLPAI